jgi:folylpolyglutamate synthase
MGSSVPAHTVAPLYCPHLCPAALKIFAAQDVDVVVLEVGIGGRLDATNIIPQPACTGITNLGFDHMEMLGDTLPVSNVPLNHASPDSWERKQ